jgi:peptidoglycan/xylan/chitin deacetylase (PgdA/CDA1 family)
MPKASVLTRRYLSPVRRVERVMPPAGGRCLTLTFEDGPTAAPPRPDLRQARWPGNSHGPVSGVHSGGAGAGGSTGITEAILDILRTYGAVATFLVIGSAADALSGVENHPALVRRMLNEGHELANHSSRHVPLGPNPGLLPPPAAGRRRAADSSAAETLADVLSLHEVVRRDYGYTMRLARPPHLVDAYAFEVYAGLGYQYLGTGLDGGGWRATSGSYDNDVETMVLGLQRALEKDGNSLRGRLVSFRDTYNQSGESPVVSALPRLMQLFRNYGYRALTASGLLEMSPFADLAPDHPAFPAAADLLGRGWWVATRENEVWPDQPVLRGELAVWTLGAVGLAESHASVAVYADVPAGHPYRRHVETAATRGYWRDLPAAAGRPVAPEARGSRVFGPADIVKVSEFREVMNRAGVPVGEAPRELAPSPETGVSREAVTHAQALVMIADALSRAEGGETPSD